MRTGRYAQGGMSLGMAVQQPGYHTPTAMDSRRGDYTFDGKDPAMRPRPSLLGQAKAADGLPLRFPTPVAGMADKGDRGDLNTAVKGYGSGGHTSSRLVRSEPAETLWSTPTRRDGESLRKVTRGKGSAERGQAWSDPLAVQVAKAEAGRFPTPTVSMTSMGDMEQARGHRKAGGYPRMTPTPSANDWKGSSKPGQRRGQLTDPALGVIEAGGQLNPTWVEWLMGFPLGWTDLEASPAHEVDPSWWAAEPDVPRVARGTRDRIDRLRALGNAVVPQCGAVHGEILLAMYEGVD